jgi:polyphosphate kinase
MTRLKKKDYERHLDALQLQLNDLSHWLQHTGQRLLVILEGRDTSGKGGTINALTEKLNPRHVHVVALAKPSDRESTQWYFQRYVPHLPAAGEMVLFDRSWYNRAGVEHVMGFCTGVEYRRFLEDAPVFERLLARDGILLRKYWLSVDQEWQEERFAERADDPLKRWKLSPIDLDARARYEEYGKARDRMFRATHRTYAPWTVVDFNDQRRGRLNVIRHLLGHVPYQQIADDPLTLEPLGRRPKRERFTGPVRPIRGWY